ncbi:MAG: hypothetical protein QHJ34_15240 [bacterium]|nr:hypothetical protein [candidate division KSB1 bacterium]MDH7561557.1 hypothetical protein [bacterium]
MHGHRLHPLATMAGAALLVAIVAPCLFGQRCAVLDSSGGNFLVNINGQTYLAVPMATAKEALKAREELSAALSRAQAADSLLACYERMNAAYERHFRLQSALIEQTQQLYAGYRQLAQDYRRIKGEAFFRFEAGVGAVRDHDRDELVPVLLVGGSMGRLGVWAFLDRRDSGFIFGGNLPVRWGGLF